MNQVVRILRFAVNHKRLLVGTYACLAGSTLAYLTLPRLFGNAIDRIIYSFESGHLSTVTLSWIIIVIVCVSIIRAVLSFGQTYFGELLSQSTCYDLRKLFYDHVQNLGWAFHDRYHTGDLMSRAITDIQAIRGFITVGLIRIPYVLALFIGVPFILLSLDWRLGMLCIITVPILSIISGINKIHFRQVWKSVQQSMASLSTILHENRSGIHVVKVFGSEQFEEEKFDVKNKEVSQSMLKAETILVKNTSFMQFVFLFLTGIVLWAGGWLTIGGHLTPGELAQFLFYMQLLREPVQSVGSLVSSFARTVAASDRLFEILDQESQVINPSGAIQVGRLSGHIRFEQVEFSYKHNTPLLRDINIDAPPGELIALLGKPGSGKSTTMHLIPRFYELSSGRITIDGIDIRDMNLKSLRMNIGFVQQDIFLFAASIKDNIAYGLENATMEKIVDAARIAQLDDFVSSLDQGYETVLGERGVTLSGGQRQRMSIARALLTNPPILILDDSTSSVDTNTEQMIRKSIESAMMGRTTFIISHRISTLHKANQILVLDEGQIVERGTHRELINLHGEYEKIYELQMRPNQEVLKEVTLNPTAIVESK